MPISEPNTSAFASQPLVTFAVPTFNRASWLKDCVDACLAQTYPHIEVLISDNASTDDTQGVLKQFQDKRVRVVRQKSNIGLLPNWNACLAEAKGDFIVFVPDDDRVPPWMLERFVTLAKDDPQISMVIALSQMHLVDESRTWRPPTNRRFPTGVYNGIEVLKEFLRDRMVTTMCSIMIGTDALRARGGFPTDVPYAADMVAFSLVLMTGKAAFINGYCGTFGVHKEGLTSTLTLEASLTDERRFVNCVSAAADLIIGDPQERLNVKSEAERCFARRAIFAFSRYRMAGGKLADLLPLIGRFRRELSHIGVLEGLSLAKPIALIVLPKPISDWIRRLKRIRGEH